METHNSTPNRRTLCTARNQMRSEGINGLAEMLTEWMRSGEAMTREYAVIVRNRLSRAGMQGVADEFTRYLYDY